jgi:hypothetical protein
MRTSRLGSTLTPTIRHMDADLSSYSLRTLLFIGSGRVSPVISNVRTLWKIVECFFLLVPFAEGEPEAYSTNECNNGNATVVPDE